MLGKRGAEQSLPDGQQRVICEQICPEMERQPRSEAMGN